MMWLIGCLRSSRGCPVSEDWRLRARCREVGWGPAFGNEPEQRAFADKVCRPCPVRVDCRLFAMRVEQGVPSPCRVGVYGGLLGPERQVAARGGLVDCEDCCIEMVPAKAGAVCRVCVRKRKAAERLAYLRRMREIRSRGSAVRRGAVRGAA